MTDVAPLRLVLDQNFPQPLLRDMADWIPPDVEIEHLGQLDDQLRSVSDRELLIALHPSRRGSPIGDGADRGHEDLVHRAVIG